MAQSGSRGPKRKERTDEIVRILENSERYFKSTSEFADELGYSSNPGVTKHLKRAAKAGEIDVADVGGYKIWYLPEDRLKVAALTPAAAAPVAYLLNAMSVVTRKPPEKTATLLRFGIDEMSAKELIKSICLPIFGIAGWSLMLTGVLSSTGIRPLIGFGASIIIVSFIAVIRHAQHYWGAEE